MRIPECTENWRWISLCTHLPSNLVRFARTLKSICPLLITCNSCISDFEWLFIGINIRNFYTLHWSLPVVASSLAHMWAVSEDDKQKLPTRWWLFRPKSGTSTSHIISGGASDQRTAAAATSGIPSSASADLFLADSYLLFEERVLGDVASSSTVCKHELDINEMRSRLVAADASADFAASARRVARRSERRLPLPDCGVRNIHHKRRAASVGRSVAGRITCRRSLSWRNTETDRI